MADFASITAKLNETVAKHRANTNLSDDGKRRLIAAAYVKADADAAAVRSSLAAENAKARRSVESSLFGMNYYDSKDPAAVMLHRDARDRASRLQTPAEAIALLESSIVGGDKVMARAILGRSFQVGALQPVLDRYVDLVPDDVPAIDELLSMNASDYDAASRASRLQRDMTANVPKPSEIRTYPQHAVEALAAEAPDVRESTPAPDYAGAGNTLNNSGGVRLTGGYDVLTGQLND